MNVSVTYGVMGHRIIEPFLIIVRLVLQKSWYVLSCLLNGAYKRFLVVNRKNNLVVEEVGLLSCYPSGHITYIGRHITVNKIIQFVIK